MKRTLYPFEAALPMAEAYPYVLARELSRIYLGPAADADIHWDEVTEARFFGPESELRFFQSEDGLRAVLIEDEAEDSPPDQTHPLAHNGAFGKSLTQRTYLEFDEDGQLYVAGTRLVDWEA